MTEGLSGETVGACEILALSFLVEILLLETLMRFILHFLILNICYSLVLKDLKQLN